MSASSRTTVGTAEAAALLGASEASVKRWADGGGLQCERTPGGHRRFLRLDLEAFAARLRGPPAEARALPDPDELGRLALRGDEAGIDKLLRPFWTGPLGIAEAIDSAISPALARVGLLWERGEISVADEHVATATFRRVAAALSAGPSLQRRGVAVLACLGAEEHDLAAALGVQVLRAAGFQAVTTGARTPAADVAGLVRRMRPQVLAVSITGAVRRSGSSGELAALAAAARAVGASLWVGGQGAAPVRLPPGARRASTLREMVAALCQRRGAR